MPEKDSRPRTCLGPLPLIEPAGRTQKPVSAAATALAAHACVQCFLSGNRLGDWTEQVEALLTVVSTPGIGTERRQCFDPFWHRVKMKKQTLASSHPRAERP